MNAAPVSTKVIELPLSAIRGLPPATMICIIPANTETYWNIAHMAHSSKYPNGNSGTPEANHGDSIEKDRKISLTPAAEKLISHAVRIANRKVSGTGIISTAVLFLASYDLARNGNELESKIIEDLFRYNKFFDKAYSDMLDIIRIREPELDRSEVIEPLGAGAKFSRSIAELLKKRIEGNALNILSAPDIIAIVLKNSKGMLSRYLEEMDFNSPNSWADELDKLVTQARLSPKPAPKQPPDAPSKPKGWRAARLIYRREVIEEHEESLASQKYAPILATLFRLASGEFFFALFGHWGIGKSHLSRKIKELMIDPEKTKTCLNISGDDTSGQVDGSTDNIPDELNYRYEVVTFSAWKYPRTPEIWIYLYQELAKSSQGRNLFESIPRVIRCQFYKHGYSFFIVTMISLLFIMLPPFEVRQIILWIGGFIGIGGGFYLYKVTRRSSTSVAALTKRYLAFADHKDKLGTQALIGKDMEALLAGWVAKPKHAPHTSTYSRQKSITVAKTTAVAMCMSIMAFLSTYFAFDHSKNKAIQKGLCGGDADAFTLFMCGADQISAPLGIQITLIILWLTICIGTLLALHFWGNPPDRVLLIVEDLDRLEPGEIIEVIESIKLLIDEPALCDRIQALVLADEAVVANAIALKFNDMDNDNPQRSRGARLAVISEHMEKLFACHFRLPDLTEKEIGELMYKYAEISDISDKESQLRARAEVIDASINNKQSTGVLAAASSTIMDNINSAFRQIRNDNGTDIITGAARLFANIIPSIGSIGNTDSEPDEAIKSLQQERREVQDALDEIAKDKLYASATKMIDRTKLRFDRSEIDSLVHHLQQLSPHFGRPVTPRVIRTYLYKYQLARMIIENMGIPFTPENIAAEFGAVITARGNGTALGPVARNTIAAVVRQVA
jgi:hypothetical protein